MDGQNNSQGMSKVHGTPPSKLHLSSLFVYIGMVLAVGVLLYVYFSITPVQETEDTQGTATTTKEVVLYTRERYDQSDAANATNATPSTIELVVAQTDGSHKRVLLSRDSTKGTVPSGFISPLTGEYVYTKTNFETPYSFEVRGLSLRDGTTRIIFEGSGIPEDAVLSPNGETIGIFVTNRILLGDPEQKDWFLSVSLKNPGQNTETPLVIENGNLYSRKTIVFWNTAGEFLVYGFDSGPGPDVPMVLGLFDKNGTNMNPPVAARGLSVGARGRVFMHTTSPDGNWYVTSEESTNLRPVYIHSIYGPSYPKKIVVHSTQDDTAVTFDSVQDLGFGGWIGNSNALIYTWGETEKGGDITGDFALISTSTTTESAVTVSTQRYGVFDVVTQAREEFTSRRKLNEWLAAHYPDEPRYEIVYTGRLVPKLVNDSTYFTEKISSAKLYVDDVLIDETGEAYRNQLEVFGFVKI